MSKVQQWVLCAALAIVVVLAAGWFLLVNPQRSKAAELRAQAAAEERRSAGLRAELAMLVAQSKQLAAKRAELAKYSRQLPSEPALPALIRALSQAAATAGVDLVSIAPSPPAPFVTGGAPPRAAGTAGTAPGATPAGSVAAGGLQSIPLNIKVTGSYLELEQFVVNLEALPRMLLVNGYTMGPSSGGGAPTSGGASGPTGCTRSSCLVDLELTSQVFIAPVVAPPPAPSSVK